MQTERQVLGFVESEIPFIFVAIHPGVKEEIDGKKCNGHEGPGEPQVQGPQEGDAAQVAEKKRGITNGQ